MATEQALLNNAGKAWSSKEDAWLLEAIKTRCIDECARNLGRTYRAITARLYIHGAAKLSVDSSLQPEDVAAEFRIKVWPLKMRLTRMNEASAISDQDPTEEMEPPEPLTAPAPTPVAASVKPKNAGKPWTPEQEDWLLKAVRKNSIVECATMMERTRGSIVARLCLYAMKKIAQDSSLTPDIVAPSLGITVSELKDFIAYDEKKRAAALKKKENAAAAAHAGGSGIAAAAPNAGPAAGDAETPPHMRTIGATQTAFVPRAEPGELNEAQKAAVAAVRRGDSILLTGPAGTGKTHTVHAILYDTDHRGASIGLTATTGAAAVLIGGRTIHSYLGIGLAKRSAVELASYTVNRLKKHADRIRDLDVLLVDEVSMMSADLFTLISKYLSLIRKDPAPFGGVQMVLVGDFAQLPPVDGKFAFKSPEWERLSPKIHELREVFRQAGDTSFQELLHRARLGRTTDEDVAALRAARNTTFPEGFVPTRLYAKNAMVAACNEASYEQLKAENAAAGGGTEVAYAPKYPNARSREWGANTGYDAPIALLPGAQVMVAWNVSPDSGIINGTRGRVVTLRPTEVVLQLLSGATATIGYMETGPEDDKSLRIGFMPLRLAYAMSIHKSQGSTLDAAETNLGDSIFEAAQAYVALSRVRSLAGIRVSDVQKRSFRAHPEVIAFYAQATPQAVGAEP